MAKALSKPSLGLPRLLGVANYVTSSAVNQQSPAGESHPWVTEWQDRNAHKAFQSPDFKARHLMRACLLFFHLSFTIRCLGNVYSVLTKWKTQSQPLTLE